MVAAQFWHPESGSQFVERILTAVMTLRQQQRDVLDYLTPFALWRGVGLARLRFYPLPDLFLVLRRFMILNGHCDRISVR